MRRMFRIALPLLFTLLFAAGTALVTAPMASANSLDCSGNAYVAEVRVQDFGGDQFEIMATPTSNARYAEMNGYGIEGTNAMWHAVQACVPGLYGTLADGIYQQIRCHMVGGLSGPLKFGGATYDFESWREPVSWDLAVYSECNWGGWPYTRIGEPYRPDQLANMPTF